jgi:hypothetical protein
MAAQRKTKLPRKRKSQLARVILEVRSNKGASPRAKDRSRLYRALRQFARTEAKEPK